MFRKAAWRGLHIVLCYCFYRGGCDVDLFLDPALGNVRLCGGNVSRTYGAVCALFVVRGILRSAVCA